ncbi:MAG: ABC transporter substrate-binding protein, partial [Dehalococcoidia bacterium]
MHAPASFNFDTFDALKTGEPTVLEVLGRTHARLVDWLEPASAILGPALAASWEQPDADRLIVHLDPAARWHDREPLNGRLVEADQVRSHLRRGAELARAGRMPAVQRPQDWLRIRNVTTPGDTIRIDTDGPDPFILNTLASRFALVQAPEAVGAFEDNWHQLRAESVVGSGPFRYEGHTDGRLRFAAHAGGHTAPLLDAMEVFEPSDLVARFRERQLDEALFRDRREAPAALAGHESAVVTLWQYEESPIITTLSVGAAPWDNVNLRRGLSAALNRGELARRLFAGRAQACGPVSPAHTAFAHTESDLARFPGYRTDPAPDLAD